MAIGIDQERRSHEQPDIPANEPAGAAVEATEPDRDAAIARLEAEAAALGIGVAGLQMRLARLEHKIRALRDDASANGVARVLPGSATSSLRRPQAITAVRAWAAAPRIGRWSLDGRTVAAERPL